METNKHKICIILGTRPELIKMAPVIRECEQRKIDYFVIHTGQHYSYEMDEIFFRDLELPKPKYNLSVGSGSHGAQTGKMLSEIEGILMEEKPEVVLVQGDTNSVLAGALAASKLRIKVGHVEAGLRSYDRNMPEETNRIISDHISDFLFVPTNVAKENLKKEGIEGNKVIVVGNTIVDSVLQNIKLAEKKSEVLKYNNIESGKYFILTIHRAENTDDEKVLSNILDGIKNIGNKYDMAIVWPMHPRTKARIEQFGLKNKLSALKNIKIIDPVGFLDFLTLESNACLAITDSGGVQEETCILGVPCVTLRENTERPETLEVGSNIIVGTDPNNILRGVEEILSRDKNWDNPFGDGTTSKKIIDRVLI